MSSVLVIGASGYIGFAISKVFRQNGFQVYGLIRKSEQATKLALNEIVPVIGDATKVDTYKHVLQKATVVIDASVDFQSPTHSIVFSEVKKHLNAHDKKIFIYTSGILVHGHSEDVVTEGQISPLFSGSIPPFLEVRTKHELDVIHATEVHGIVIRPGFVYGFAGGNGGSHSVDIFNFEHGKIVIKGRKDKSWSWVHIYDLARAYLLAVQHFNAASGQIFDIASPDPPTYEVLRKKAAAIAGYKDAEVVQLPVPDDGNPFNALLECTVRVSYQKAKNLLGWTPSHLDVLDELATLYEAYKASKTKI